MEDFKLYLGGKFISGSKTHAVTDKYTQESFAKTSLADASLVEDAIEIAFSNRKKIAEWPIYERYNALSRVAYKIDQQAEQLAELLARESGKPLIYARAEITRASQTFSIAASACRNLEGKMIRMDINPQGQNKTGFIQYFPVGVVAGISPFNFPMNLAVHKIAPALATGCPIILKPASSTPLSTLALARILDDCGIPMGSVSILPTDREKGMQLVIDDRINLLSFTGSPDIGWTLKSQCRKKKIVLELGGNAAVIVSPNTDLSVALDKCIVGAFAYSGQICIHAQRFFVHESIFDAFVKGMLKRVESFIIGNPLSSATQFSVMIDESNAERVDNWVDEAIGGGAKVLKRGKRNRNYLDPILLTQTTAAMKVRSEEVFGPVICIEPYHTFEEAVDLVNDSKFGLQCGVFTNLISELDYAFQHIEVGGLIHNDAPTLRFDHMPYGGIKESGIGREGVPFAMLDMLESKILVK